MKNILLPILAATGVIFASAVSVITDQRPAPAEPYSWPPTPPFEHFIAGSGMIEPGNGSYHVGSPVSGIVKRTYVSVGATVQQGQLLLEMDDRLQRAELEMARAQMQEALMQLERSLAAPRPQEREIAMAAAQAAWADFRQADTRLERINSLSEPNVLSAQERQDAELHAKELEAAFTQAMLRAEMAEEGTWERDLAIQQAALKSAEMAVERALMSLAQTRIESPIDGSVLIKEVDAGEYVSGDTRIVLGRRDYLRCRCDIDEVDAWRVDVKQPAVAFLRGNSRVAIPLKFLRIEPFVRPKKSLTLDDAEQIDVRVFQVVYTFEPGALPVPVYVGQLVDVFIESPIDTYHGPQQLEQQ